MLAGELAHQAGMKKPKIRAADWDYLSTHPLSGPPRASAAIWPSLLKKLVRNDWILYFMPHQRPRIPKDYAEKIIHLTVKYPQIDEVIHNPLQTSIFAI
jgi:hypothetical protein